LQYHFGMSDTTEFAATRVTVAYRFREVDALRILLRLKRSRRNEMMAGNCIRLNVARVFNWRLDSPAGKCWRIGLNFVVRGWDRSNSPGCGIRG
jgi:hypothetical protein